MENNNALSGWHTRVTLLETREWFARSLSPPWEMTQILVSVIRCFIAREQTYSENHLARLSKDMRNGMQRGIRDEAFRALSS